MDEHDRSLQSILAQTRLEAEERDLRRALQLSAQVLKYPNFKPAKFCNLGPLLMYLDILIYWILKLDQSISYINTFWLNLVPIIKIIILTKFIICYGPRISSSPCQK